jgi:putative DNA primase/helicase
MTNGGIGNRRKSRRIRAQSDDTAASLALNRRLAFFPMTDLGNIERFRERNRGMFMCCILDGWSWRNGRRWCHDGVSERLQLAIHSCVRSIQLEADSIAGTNLDKPVGGRGPKVSKKPRLLSAALREWGRASEANAKLNQIKKQAWVYFVGRE